MVLNILFMKRCLTSLSEKVVVIKKRYGSISLLFYHFFCGNVAETSLNSHIKHYLVLTGKGNDDCFDHSYHMFSKILCGKLWKPNLFTNPLKSIISKNKKAFHQV